MKRGTLVDAADSNLLRRTIALPEGSIEKRAFHRFDFESLEKNLHAPNTPARER